MKRIEKSSIYIWWAHTLQYYGIRAVGLWAVFSLIDNYNVPYLSVIKWLVVGYIAINFIKEMISAVLNYKNTRYILENQVIRSVTGGFSSTELTVPMERVQHVSINQTFLSRFYNVYGVTVYTAGNNLYLRFLSEKEANEMKKQITDYLLQKGKMENEKAA